MNFQKDEIPELEVYSPSYDELTEEQREFYDIWIESWNSDDPIPVDDQIGYIFIHIYELLEKAINSSSREPYLDELVKISEEYDQKDKIVHYSKRLAAEVLIEEGQYQEALTVYPRPSLSGRSTATTNGFLSLKLYLEKPLEGREALTLFGPKVTDAVSDNLNAVKNYVDVILDEERSQIDGLLLEKWSENTHENPNGFGLYRGTFHQTYVDIPSYSFHLNDEVEEFVEDITRRAENMLREDLGLDHVGEGWVSETKLYYLIVEVLSDHKVIHHASPHWLNQQHLDIFIPELDLAIEYQGKQHYEPVEHFGGEESFKEQKQRDKTKAQLCTKNNTELIRWHYDRPLKEYEVEEVLEEFI